MMVGLCAAVKGNEIDDGGGLQKKREYDDGRM